MTSNQPAAHDDPKSMLDAVKKSQRRTREKLQPGFVDFVTLLVALLAASVVTGDVTSRNDALFVAALLAVNTYTVIAGYRARRRLGGRVQVVTWLAPVVLFAVDVVIGLTFNGNTRESLFMLTVGIAAIALTTAFHDSYFAELGVGFVGVGIAQALQPPVGVYVGLGVLYLAFLGLRIRKARAACT